MIAANIIVWLVLSVTPQGRVCMSSMSPDVHYCGPWALLDQANRERDALNFEYSGPLNYWVETKDAH